MGNGGVSGPAGDLAVALAVLPTPLGPMVAAASDRGVHRLGFAEAGSENVQLASAARQFTGATRGPHPVLRSLQAELAEYFAGRRTHFSTPLSYRGTPFQERAWCALLDIPFGTTRTYEEMATAVGSAGAQRAIGRANHTNPIALLIPCHRVINKDGSLGGYGAGSWRKQVLLDLERTGHLNLGLFGP